MMMRPLYQSSSTKEHYARMDRQNAKLHQQMRNVMKPSPAPSGYHENAEQAQKRQEEYAKKQAERREQEASKKQTFLDETMVDNGHGGLISYRQHISNCASVEDEEDRQLCERKYDTNKVLGYLDVFDLRQKVIARRNDPNHPEYRAEDEAKLEEITLDCNNQIMFKEAKQRLHRKINDLLRILDYDGDSVLKNYVGAITSVKKSNFDSLSSGLKYVKGFGTHNRSVVETFMKLVHTTITNILNSDLQQVPAVREELYKNFCNKKCTKKSCRIEMVQSTRRASAEMKLREQIDIAENIIEAILLQELVNLKNNPDVLEIKRLNEFSFVGDKYQQIKANAQGMNRARQYENFEMAVKRFIVYFEIVFGDRIEFKPNELW
jgi:hypothetical protein